MTNTFFLICSFLFGLFLGSFVNVLVVRNDQRLSIITGRSHCPHCKHTLAWYDLIPLLSFLFLAGKCRYCKKPIAGQYPLMELFAAFLSLFAVYYGWVIGDSWWLAAGLLVSILLFLAISLIDIRTLEVPPEYCLVAGLIGAAAMIGTGTHTLLQTVLGIVTGAGSLAIVLYGWKLLFKQDGMGEGDLWIAGAIGAIVGYPLIIIALMAAVFSGALIGLFLLLVQKKDLQMAIPFGPFLFFGLLLALSGGQAILNWYILSL